MNCIDGRSEELISEHYSWKIHEVHYSFSNFRLIDKKLLNYSYLRLVELTLFLVSETELCISIAELRNWLVVRLHSDTIESSGKILSNNQLQLVVRGPYCLDNRIESTNPDFCWALYAWFATWTPRQLWRGLGVQGESKVEDLCAFCVRSCAP